MVLVDFSEFGDAVKTVVPIVALDVGFDEETAFGKIFDGSEIFERYLIDFDFVGGVHEGLKREN